MRRWRILTIGWCVHHCGRACDCIVVPAASQEGGGVHIETITKYKTETDTFLDLGKRGLSASDRFIQALT
jgi:hypothetical protein